MKKAPLIALVVAAVFSAAVPSQARLGGDFGLGVQIGEPSAALSGKLWLGKMTAVDMALGFSARHDWILLQADHIWHHFDVIPVESGEAPVYYGMGATVVAGDDETGIGLQGVVGISYLFPAAPLDIFFDLSPGAFIIPEPEPNFGAALGMRYFF